MAKSNLVQTCEKSRVMFLFDTFNPSRKAYALLEEARKNHRLQFENIGCMNTEGESFPMLIVGYRHYIGLKEIRQFVGRYHNQQAN